jgi:hypothetical protein
VKVTFLDHQAKGHRLADALREAGHEVVGFGGEVALLDGDAPIEPYQAYCDTHDRVMVYPHGGGNPYADGHWPVHRNTVCRFVPGPGQVEVLQLCGYSGRLEVIGWPMCDRLPFRATDKPVEVLFAPQHALGDGWVCGPHRAANRRTHDLLVSLPVHLTVRYVPVVNVALEALGITRHPGVDYRSASPVVTDGEAAIDAADVVVAVDGTFPSLAVARGCPTVVCGQIPADNHITGTQGDHISSNWDTYKDVTHFPLDADDVSTAAELMDLLLTASRDDSAVAEWRSRFVGEQFDPDLFVKT